MPNLRDLKLVELEEVDFKKDFGNGYLMNKAQLVRHQLSNYESKVVCWNDRLV